jgi:hypothetical protein
VSLRADHVERLRACLAKESDWHRVERCFREGLPDDQVEESPPIVFAFGYMLIASRRDELREREGVFGPQFQIGGSVFPPPLAEISNPDLDLWDELAAATADFPVAASRLNDLLWVRRHGEDLGERGRAAFGAYMSLVPSADTMDAVDCMLRAIEIAVEMKDRERIEEAVALAAKTAREEISESIEWRPGVSLNLLEVLADLKPEQRPDDLVELIESAGERYAQDPTITQAVSELKAALANPEEREELRRQQVNRWREEANKGDGLLRYVRLQQALGYARNYSFGDLAEEILTEMQSMKCEDFDMAPISASVEVPTAEIDRHVESYGEVDSWQDALWRFGSEGPPSGEVEANTKLTRELAERYPLHRIFRTQIIGPFSSPVFEASNDEDHDRVELARHETMRILFWAPIGSRILALIKETYPEPADDELADFFSTDLIDREVAERIANGVTRYLSGDLEGALHILVPQLEAAIRGVAARAGIAVIKTPRDGRPGGVQALGSLLGALEGVIDESWRRYFVNSLTDVLGLNLRNQVSHGLHGPAAGPEIVVLIHIACQLRLWKIDSAAQPDDDPD